MSLTREVL